MYSIPNLTPDIVHADSGWSYGGLGDTRDIVRVNPEKGWSYIGLGDTRNIVRANPDESWNYDLLNSTTTETTPILTSRRAPSHTSTPRKSAHPIMDAVDRTVLAVALVPWAIIITICIAPITLVVSIRSLIKHGDFRAVPFELRLTTPLTAAYHIVMERR